jgi:hypothetical protein
MNTINLTKKMYLNYAIAIVLTICVFFALDMFSDMVRITISTIAAFLFEAIGSRVIYKDKIVLNFYNSVMDKDIKFSLDDNKKIDMVNIRSRYDDYKTSDEDHRLNAKEQLQAMLQKHIDTIKAHKNLYLMYASKEEEMAIRQMIQTKAM